MRGKVIGQLNEAVMAYQEAWQGLLSGRANAAFFASLVPVSAGWKVAGIHDFDVAISTLREHCDHIHMTYKNNRWLATLHLKEQAVAWNIKIINVMQRRPESQDTTGLDNINFYVPQFALAEETLAAEPELKWTRESNGPYSSWLSIWFADTEAKLRAETVLDIDLRALRDVRNQVMEGIR